MLTERSGVWLLGRWGTQTQRMGNRELLRLRFDAFELDEADARLTRDGRPIALPPKAVAEREVLKGRTRRSPSGATSSCESIDRSGGEMIAKRCSDLSRYCFDLFFNLDLFVTGDS